LHRVLGSSLLDAGSWPAHPPPLAQLCRRTALAVSVPARVTEARWSRRGRWFPARHWWVAAGGWLLLGSHRRAGADGPARRCFSATFFLRAASVRCWAFLGAAGCCCLTLTGVVGRCRASPLSYGLGCVAGVTAFGCCWALLAAAGCCFRAVPGVSGRRRASPSPSGLGCAAGLAVSGGSWAFLRALWAGWVVLGRAGRTRRVGRVEWAGRACRGGGAGRLPPI